MEMYGTIVVLDVTLAASAAQAAGLYLYELGTPDLGLAAAGRAALANDASTVIGNPAGMTRLERSQLTGSMYTIIPSMQFDRGPNTTFSGGNGFNAGAPIPSLSSVSIPFPAGGLFYVYSLSPDFKLGVGAASAYGGGMNYGKEWVGRYFTQKLQLLSGTLNPGFAYRINEWLSIGAGFSVNYALLSETVAVNNLTDSRGVTRRVFQQLCEFCRPEYKHEILARRSASDTILKDMAQRSHRGHNLREKEANT